MSRKQQPKVRTEFDSSPSGLWLLLLLPLLAVVASLTLSYLWNEDFWWYLTSGRAIVENRGIPEEDPFLYTSGKGIGWVYHSWLWTVVVALLERFAGLGAVVVFHALLAAAITVLLYTTARVDRLGLVNALAVVLFLVTIRHRLCGKAEVATWLLLVVFYHLLERRGGFTWRRGAALGVLQVLWANLHGGFPLGVFLVLCYSVGGWVQERFAAKARGPSALRYPPLWLPLLLFLLAVADPRMFKERLAPFGFVTGAESVQPVGESGLMLILEWRSPFSATVDDPVPAWLFVIAAVAALASFAVVRRRSLPRFLFLVGMAVLAASAIRHLSGLALAAALVVLSNLAEKTPVQGAAARRRKGRRAATVPPARSWLYPSVCGLLALFLLAAALSLRFAVRGFEGGQSGRFFTMKPAMASPGAADFVLERNLPPPIFNDYQLGAYLSFRLFPRHRLFIDSRVIDTSVVVDYTKMVASEADWRRADARYGFKTVVLGNYSKTVRSPLGLALLRDPDWRLVYVDPLAVVFTRDGGTPGPPKARLRLPDGDGSRVPFTDPPGFVPLMAGLQRIFLNDFPSNYLIEYLAVLGQIGRVGDVRDLASEALATMPEQPLLYRQRCAAQLVLGNVQAAVDDCGKAYDLLPTDSQVTTLYCTVLARAGRKREALSVLDEALRRAPADRRLQELRRSLGR